VKSYIRAEVTITAAQLGKVRSQIKSELGKQVVEAQADLLRIAQGCQ
jgi:hypothetical protein